MNIDRKVRNDDFSSVGRNAELLIQKKVEREEVE